MPEGWAVNKYLWATLALVAAYIPLAAAEHRLGVSMGAAYATLGVAFANSAARTYSAWRRGGSNDLRRGWLFNAIDTVLIALAVRFTGGAASDLWLLYFVLMMSEALYSSATEIRALLLMLLCSYVWATWADIVGEAAIGHVAARALFLLLVGRFARRLTVTQDARNRDLARLREQVAASEERARIAREVHDGLGHALVQAILRLELCLRLFHRDPKQAEEILSEELPAIRAAWSEGRDLAFHLRPWKSEGEALAASLRRNVGRFAERTGIAVDLNLPADDLSLPAAAEMAVVRILQEALTNVARHARASRVSVTVELRKGSVRCAVVDDGVGFAPEQMRAGFGLEAMRERAENLGGTFAAHTGPGGGAVIEVDIPLK